MVDLSYDREGAGEQGQRKLWNRWDGKKMIKNKRKRTPTAMSGNVKTVVVLSMVVLSMVVVSMVVVSMVVVSMVVVSMFQ